MPWKLGLEHMLTMMFKMLTSMKLDYLHFFDQYTGLELDPVGAAAARQPLHGNPILTLHGDYRIRTSTPDGSVSANGTEALWDAVDRL